jgi:hypothetical protein
MTIDERLERLTGIVESLAASVVSHDDQIEALAKLAEKHDAGLVELRKGLAELRMEQSETQRLLQAYLRRLPPQ